MRRAVVRRMLSAGLRSAHRLRPMVSPTGPAPTGLMPCPPDRAPRHAPLAASVARTGPEYGFRGWRFAQVRALIRGWSEEREMARLLRESAKAEAGRAQVLRSAAESIDTWGIGSRDAIAYGVRTLDWVKFCEWKTDADGVRRSMIIGTLDGGGMDDARRGELQSVLDAHRSAGARVLMDVDGTSFTHPPPPVPCSKCGVQTLASGECSNFPACPNAILPF